MHRPLRRQLTAATLAAASTLGSLRADASWEIGTATHDCLTGRPALYAVLINEAGASPATVAVARGEVRDIWHAAGIHIVWLDSDDLPAGLAGRRIFVMVRRDFAAAATGAAHASRHGHRALGRVLFAESGRPSSHVDVSLPRIAAYIAPMIYGGREIGDLPALVREPLIGRALGRVIAHEIGHWLFGRGHAADGLMRSRLRRAELVAPEPLPLPTGWTAASPDLLRIREPECTGVITSVSPAPAG